MDHRQAGKVQEPVEMLEYLMLIGSLFFIRISVKQPLLCLK